MLFSSLFGLIFHQQMYAVNVKIESLKIMNVILNSCTMQLFILASTQVQAIRFLFMAVLLQKLQVLRGGSRDFTE